MPWKKGVKHVRRRKRRSRRELDDRRMANETVEERRRYQEQEMREIQPYYLSLLNRLRKEQQF